MMLRGAYCFFLKRPPEKWCRSHHHFVASERYCLTGPTRYLKRHSYDLRCHHRQFLIAYRSIGSRTSGVEKDSAEKKVDSNYPEQNVTIYTCEHLYERWKKENKFISIPRSGVFANISYVDTMVTNDGENQVNSDSSLTVLCVHGIPGNYGVFSHLINELGAHGIRTIVPTFPDDLYLQGKHRKELFRHSVEEKTQVFKDFLKALQISKLDAIIAHSSAIYPALRLALDPDLKVKCQIFFNTGGHKKTVTMKPYWVVWTCTYLYLHPVGRKFVQKTGKFIMKYILRTPIKDDNLDGVMMLAVTMVFSEYWKAKDQFLEIAGNKFPTLLCFSEDDKVVEKQLTYEVISLLGASRENISYYDQDANLKIKGKDMSWLQLMSFEKGSHYVFRKHSEICNQKVLEILMKLQK